MLDALQTTTSTTLLEGLRDTGDDATWTEFDARYRPILVGFARRLGLHADDAADVSQDVLTQFIQDYRAGKYVRERGRLRTWLITIVKRRVIDLHRARKSRREARGSSAMIDLSNEAALNETWESERNCELLRQALIEIRDSGRTHPTTLKAFELYVLKNCPAAGVAAELGIPVATVYCAKNRVSERLGEIVERLGALFDE